MSLKLRALEPSDLDLLYEIENDSSARFSTSAPLPYSRFALKQFIKRSLTEDFHTLRQLRLVIEAHDSSSPCAVGFVDLCDFSPQHRRAEVGIIVFPAFRQRGYGSQALRLLCDLSQHALSLHQLYAYVIEGNIASQKAFQRAGFAANGRMEDWFLQESTYENAVFYQKRL